MMRQKKYINIFKFKCVVKEKRNIFKSYVNICLRTVAHLLTYFISPFFTVLFDSLEKQ